MMSIELCDYFVSKGFLVLVSVWIGFIFFNSKYGVE